MGNFSAAIASGNVRKIRADLIAAETILCNAFWIFSQGMAYTALGGFDERYFAYHEESDLCMRAFLSGWKCAYAPEAIVYHRGSFSFNTIQKKMVFLHERNRVWFIYKFYPLSYIGKNIFWILLWQLRVARVWIIKRNAGWIFFKALYAGFKGRACFREERKKNSIAFNEKRREFDIFVRQKKIPLQ